jgi:hypothetical protein
VRRTVRRSLGLLPVGILALENLVIYWRHYFGGYGFPWDFLGSYYAAAAYWTEAVSRGALPMWMPYQSMGYPFLLNLQTGLFYPPMWIFPLLKIPFTLPAAVVFQCLHVLAGALGMYALARGLLRSRREALLAGFCFQLFGGFYSNAEHVDIIRSFALTPWLLWACIPPRTSEGGGLPRRILLAPLFVFAMAVGGYPGNLIAALFLVAVFALFVLVQSGFGRDTWKWALSLGAAAALGLGMAAIHLGPAWMYRDELLRYHNAEKIFRASLGVVHLPGLLLENKGMPIEKSMTSTFVGFAVIAGVCFLTKTTLKKLWPFAALALLSAAMAAGDNLPVAPLLRRLFPPIGYSRFPASDYRGVFAILLILLAAAGWRDLRHRRLGPLGLLVRFVPAALFAGWSLDQRYGIFPYWHEQALAEVTVIAVVAALAAWRLRRPVAGLLVMLAVISLDAVRVLPRIEGWAEANVLEICRQFAPTPARMYDAGLVVAPDIFAAREGPRPPRELGDGPYRASGYLRGDFLVADFGAAAGLEARDTLMRKEPYLALMCREWMPLLFDDSLEAGAKSAEIPALPPATLPKWPDSPDPRVVQESLALDGARYRVEIDRPMLLVENEIFFPGWSSDRAGEAVRVNGLLRGWRLPAGTYTLETRFRLTGLGVFAAISAAAWILWLLWLARSPRRTPRAA